MSVSWKPSAPSPSNSWGSRRPRPLADLGHRGAPHRGRVHSSAQSSRPGAESAPFSNSTGEGWEDDLKHPRRAGELIFALEIILDDRRVCLERWTPAMLQDGFRREVAGNNQILTRQSVRIRLLTHDGYHGGEISQTLGMHGLRGVDLWTGRHRCFPSDGPPPHSSLEEAPRVRSREFRSAAANSPETARAADRLCRRGP